jgi:hypothetical protein
MQPFYQHVAAALILGGNLVDALLVAFQGSDSGDLQRREGTVVVVTLNARQALTSVLLPTIKPIRQPAML